jgi:hypothetical protein
VRGSFGDGESLPNSHDSFSGPPASNCRRRGGLREFQKRWGQGLVLPRFLAGFSPAASCRCLAPAFVQHYFSVYH